MLISDSEISPSFTALKRASKAKSESLGSSKPATIKIFTPDLTAKIIVFSKENFFLKTGLERSSEIIKKSFLKFSFKN